MGIFSFEETFGISPEGFAQEMEEVMSEFGVEIAAPATFWEKFRSALSSRWNNE